MTGPGVVFAKDWVMDDCCCHVLQKYQIEILTQRRKEANVLIRNGPCPRAALPELT